MKKLLVIIVILICSTQIFQAQKCPTVRNIDLIKKSNIDSYNQIIEIENRTSEYLKNQTGKSLTMQTTIHIPVVVHVVYSNSTQNISDDQINSQIEVLNEDFKRLNADKANTPSEFSSVASTSDIDFFLACIDPNGNPTSGITRTSTAITEFPVYLNPDHTADEVATRIKYTSTGGCDAWPSNKYLNSEQSKIEIYQAIEVINSAVKFNSRSYGK